MEKWRPKLALDTEHLLAGISDNSNRNPYTKSKLMKNVLLQVNTCRKISARRKQSKRQQSNVRRLPNEQMLTLKITKKLWDVYTLTSKFLTGSLCRTVATNFHEICTEWINMMFHWKCTIILPGGGVLSPKSYVDVPAGHRKSNYLYSNFLPNFPPISIPFLKEKHPILIKLGAFYNNLPKIHPIYVIWAPSSLMKPPIAIPNFAKKCPKRQAHVRIPCQCENPPPG